MALDGDGDCGGGGGGHCCRVQFAHQKNKCNRKLEYRLLDVESADIMPFSNYKIL